MLTMAFLTPVLATKSCVSRSRAGSKGSGPPVIPGVAVPGGTVPSAASNLLCSIIESMCFTVLVKRSMRKRQAFTTTGRLLAGNRSDVRERGPPRASALGEPAVDDHAVVAHHPTFLGMRDEVHAGPIPERAEGNPQILSSSFRPHPGRGVTEGVRHSVRFQDRQELIFRERDGLVRHVVQPPLGLRAGRIGS